MNLLGGKKLLALDEESQTYLRETIKAYRDEEVDIDLKTSLSELFSEVRDTLIMEKDKFILPISVLENADFQKFARTDKVKSANKKVDFYETIKGLGEGGADVKRPRPVVEILNDFFDELHTAISDRRFGFAGGIRATGKEEL